MYSYCNRQFSVFYRCVIPDRTYSCNTCTYILYIHVLRYRFNFEETGVFCNSESSEYSETGVVLYLFLYPVLVVSCSFLFAGGSCKSKSLACKLRTSTGLRGCPDGVYSGCSHDVATCCRHQHRSRDSIARVNTVIFFTVLRLVLFTIVRDHTRSNKNETILRRNDSKGFSIIILDNDFHISINILRTNFGFFLRSFIMIIIEREFCVFRMLPETPAWLASRGRTDEAKKALLWLRGPGFNVDKEYQELCESNAKRKERKESLLQALHMPNVWKPFLILLVFFTLQQLSGIYVILFYAVNVLRDIGIDMNEYAASVGMAFIRLFASILGAGLANNLGRRVLAFVSGFGMAIAAMGIAFFFRFASLFNNHFLFFLSFNANFFYDFIILCPFIFIFFIQRSYLTETSKK